MIFSRSKAFRFALAASLVLLAVGWVYVDSLPKRVVSPAIHVLAVSDSGKRIAAGTTTGAIRIWDLAERKPILSIDSSPGALNDLRFAADDRFLTIANRNLTLVTLEPKGPNIEILSDASNYGSVRFSPDGSSLLTINGRGAILIFDRQTKLATQKYCCTSIWGDIEFGLDGSLAIWAGHWPGIVDLRSGSLVGRLTGSSEVMTFGPVLLTEQKVTFSWGVRTGGSINGIFIRGVCSTNLRHKKVMCERFQDWARVGTLPMPVLVDR